MKKEIYLLIFVMTIFVIIKCHFVYHEETAQAAAGTIWTAPVGEPILARLSYSYHRVVSEGTGFS
jgi:hypothetical protein